MSGAAPGTPAPVTAPHSDRPAWVTEAEEEYVERTDESLDNPDPETTPSGETVQTDRNDATAAHVADRPPTAEEEAIADGLELDPDVAASYKEAAERGAHIEGEGKI